MKTNLLKYPVIILGVLALTWAVSTSNVLADNHTQQTVPTVTPIVIVPTNTPKPAKEPTNTPVPPPPAEGATITPAAVQPTVTLRPAATNAPTTAPTNAPQPTIAAPALATETPAPAANANANSNSNPTANPPEPTKPIVPQVAIPAYSNNVSDNNNTTTSNSPSFLLIGGGILLLLVGLFLVFGRSTSKPQK